jgi:dihydrolipoamide dehydrogenase
VPRATFVDPEVASIGYTEAGARAAGLDIVTHSFSFAHLDRAILYGDARGYIKLIVESHTGQIVGAHLVGPHASSILAEIALAMQHHLPVSAIAETMHAYPTFPEAVEAAAMTPGSRL